MRLDFTQKLWGYSEKVGPVYHNDREENMSSKKREEIENEVRLYVVGLVQFRALLISLGGLRVMGGEDESGVG